ncbi:MAG: bifunctional (p)ppGpp synthetase/guanosine-3',5'-bis(diphosphate) 3'-pyrophosphohydrolase [Roseiflexaceae bacterium]|nr:bifunctional (p)ppGpp synthetase/guanosine-3',5'-bis(diphosphate) 3'-pyrophosphohydrolase [Roseiflexaceae bacterium]
MRIWSQERYRQAAHVAAEAHQGQLVPGTTLPYLLHLTNVAMELMTALALEAGHDADLAVQCALLHDLLEDTATTYAELQASFGPAVAAGVAALTKDSSLDKAQQMPDSLRRIQQQPPEIWMVKLADRITNMHAPPATWSQAKRRQYRDEAETIHAALHTASPLLAERLQQLTRQYARYLD